MRTCSKNMYSKSSPSSLPVGNFPSAIAFLIYTIVLFGERLENYVIIFASVAGGMLLLLAGFLAFVRGVITVMRS